MPSQPGLFSHRFTEQRKTRIADRKTSSAAQEPDINRNDYRDQQQQIKKTRPEQTHLCSPCTVPTNNYLIKHDQNNLFPDATLLWRGLQTLEATYGNGCQRKERIRARIAMRTANAVKNTLISMFSRVAIT